MEPAYPSLAEALADCYRNTRYLFEFGLERSDIGLKNAGLAATIARGLEFELDSTRAAELMRQAESLYSEVFAVCEAEGERIFDLACADAQEVLASGALPVHVEDQVRAAMAERGDLECQAWMVASRRLRLLLDVDTAREQ